MKKMTDILLLIEDYQGSYTEAMESDPRMHVLRYDEAKRELFSKAIYYGNAYQEALSRQGLMVEQIIPACKPLRQKWAEENGISLPAAWTARAPMRWWWTRVLKTPHPKEHIGVTEQIKKLKPKVLWVFSGVEITKHMLNEWRPYVGLIILWWSCPVDNFSKYPFGSFDAVFSCIPALVGHFNKQGIKAYHLPHAFDPNVLSYVKAAEKRIEKMAFIGSVFSCHENRISVLDRLSRYIDIDFYGSDHGLFPKDCPVLKNRKSAIWGKELFAAYGTYLFALHININVAKKEASAKRLFEATGMGSCLFTDSVDGLEDLFEPEKEVVTFRSAEECADKARYFLAHSREALEIGRKGQERTLRDHTYAVRANQLLRILKKLGYDRL